MDFLVLFITVCMINSALYFLDVLFKTCLHYPYIRFLQETGLDIGFFRISWFTTYFNRSFQKWGSLRPKILQQWFSFGVWSTVFLLPVSVYILLLSISNTWSSKSNAVHRSHLVLEPVVPGVNLPLSDIIYYIIAIAVCSIVHELGHVIAAVREDVHISGTGFIIAFIVPMAYVKINSEQLVLVHPKRQLRIFCAGIWHNIVLAAFAYSLLVMIPIIFYPVFDIGRGVSVQNIKENSQVIGPSGILVGDKLVAINDCEVSDTDGWRQCLMSFYNQPAPGYCVNEDMVHQLDESVPVKHLGGGIVECCDKSNDAHLCFETLEDDDPLQILQYSCLPGRPVIAGTAYTCRSPKDCPPSLHCVRPVLSNGTTLLRIQRSHGNVVIFIGRPYHVLSTVQVSDFVPIYDTFPAQLPETLIRLTKYLALFSSGLAVINAIPCFYFDGNHITYALLNYCFSSHFRYRNLIGFIFNILGTLLLIFHFSSLMWRSFHHYLLNSG